MRKDDRNKKEVKTRNTHNALGYTRKKEEGSHSFSNNKNNNNNKGSAVEGRSKAVGQKHNDLRTFYFDKAFA